MWFLTSERSAAINRREVPLDTDEIHKLVDESQPINMWQSLMQAAPGENIKLAADEPNIIKEALLDCMEMLTDQDKFVIDAIIYEQITYPKLAKRLGVSTPHAWRLTQAAFANLKELLMMNSTLRDYLIPDEQ
jgi:DNA-directed RNA polymerase specialized sigma subunit